MADKLPVWANNDLATYSAFTGLPADLTKSAPKTIDPQKSTKGLDFMPGDESSGTSGTYRFPVPTPAGWDPTVKVYANYDSQGNLTNFSGSNPVFPADENGKLNGKSKFNPVWDASGKAEPIQNTTHGGWEGTPMVMAGLSMIPGVAPVMAGLNAANSLAHGKFDTSTILNGLTAATGLGANFGMDPALLENLKVAQKVAGGINAIQTKNVPGIVNGLMQMAGSSNDAKVVTNALNAITALNKNNLAGALSALNNITGSVDPQVVNFATKVINQIQNPGSLTTPSINVPAVLQPTAQPAAQPPAQPASQPQANTAPTADLNAVQSMQFANALGIPTSLLYKAPKQEYFGATAQVIDPKTGEVKFVKESPTDIQPTTPAFELQNSPMVAKREQTSENDRNSFADNLASNDVTFDDVLNILRG